MGILSEEATLNFVPLFSRGQLIKENNLLLYEQILSFNSRPFLVGYSATDKKGLPR